MSNRANRRLRRQEQRVNPKVACQPVQAEAPPRTVAMRPRLLWLSAAVLAVFATVLGLHHVSRAAAVAPSSALAPVSKQIVAPAETLPTCVIAHEGDVNAKWLRATRMKTEGDQVTLTLCDDATGERSTLSAPKSTILPSKADGQGGDLVLARLATVPEHMDLDHYAFSTGPIEKVQKGQKVVSRDPQTGKTELKTVARTFEHKAYELVELELADAQTGVAADKLRGTPEHPFFTPGGMVPMGKLAAGQQVTTRDGKTLVVKSTRREAHPEGVPVYNFEVGDDHTYFVGQANGGTWVHNDCVPPDLANLDSHALNSMAKRGWSPAEITEAYTSGQQFPATDLTAGGAPATRYVHPVTGNSVVINNATGRVIHVGGPGFKY